MKLFIRAYFQILFVAANTYMIAQINYIGILICSFFVSFLWTFNVCKINIGNNKDKIIYSLGASLGAISGVFISSLLK